MWEYQICDVCFFVDGDSSVKPCQYCDQCEAWICQVDQGNIGRRALAMMKRGMRRLTA